tara:strand:+ start:5131 stop:7065 length:1935 start_codon:yes stop_codon:yes gene_type:complete
MKLKRIMIILGISIFISSCTDLDIPPKNILGEDDIFSSIEGVESNLARIYSRLPIEDFKYSHRFGFNVGWAGYWPRVCATGQAIGRDMSPQYTYEEFRYWDDAYAGIRDINMLIEKLPDYSVSLGEEEVQKILGEAHFARAYTYYALVKRYGGVPLVNAVIDYPASVDLEGTQLYRDSEEAIWDFIASDLDYAIEQMSENSAIGRANKYVAAAFKSRAMLYAGCIAKYNTISKEYNSARICGIPANRANDYFKAAFDAAKIVTESGKFELFKGLWQANDPVAQYENFKYLFMNETSENIFVKYYDIANNKHDYDHHSQPHQTKTGGNDSEINPTLDFVEMFDGIAKDENGNIKNIDDEGNYYLFDSPLDAFANAEPRLRATVILPMDVFRNQVIDIRRGIWTGDASGGIPALAKEGDIGNYNQMNDPNLILAPGLGDNPVVELNPGDPNGPTMKAAGKNGPVSNWDFGNISGFYVRKYMRESGTTDGFNSTQSWIEIRYAEVLLNMAEAAYELQQAGISGDNYQTVAFSNINKIRERAGATLLASEGELNNINIIRTERRKELSFENKTYWDFKRWRIYYEEEQNNRRYRVLMPFYSTDAQKYFLSAKYKEADYVFTYDTRYYYQPLPESEINKNPNIVQNPGF